jgi:hypothetical protein
VIRELSAVAERRGFAPTLLVASAGYGLVSATAHLKPYSATFARGADSVLVDADGRDTRNRRLRDWWNGLSEWAGPKGHKGPRSLEKLAKHFADSTILVIASPDYVMAMGDDLRKAASALRHPERLVIISSTSGFPKDLDDHLVPSVAALQSRLGGSLGSLHARTARHLLANARRPLHVKRLAARYRQQASTAAKPARRPNRKSRSDDQVRKFIDRSIAASTTPSCSKLLRAYRDGGCKCEQHRFRRLFDEVTQRRKAS